MKPPYVQKWCDVTEAEKRTGAVKKSPSDKEKVEQPNALVRYFRETRGELRKVTWPTREESQRLTAIVLGVSLVMSIFLWVFDAVFSSVIQWVLTTLGGI